MIIKEINILEDIIEIKEEKKGIFKIKEYITKINVEKIDRIERLLEDNKLIGIILWHERDVLHAIGFKNYKNDLDDIYNKIFNLINNKQQFIEIIETEL